MWNIERDRERKDELPIWKVRFVRMPQNSTSYHDPSHHEEEEKWWWENGEPSTLLDTETLKDLHQLLSIPSVDSPAKS